MPASPIFLSFRKLGLMAEKGYRSRALAERISAFVRSKVYGLGFRVVAHDNED